MPTNSIAAQQMLASAYNYLGTEQVFDTYPGNDLVRLFGIQDARAILREAVGFMFLEGLLCQN